MKFRKYFLFFIVCLYVIVNSSCKSKTVNKNCSNYKDWNYYFEANEEQQSKLDVLYETDGDPIYIKGYSVDEKNGSDWISIVRTITKDDETFDYIEFDQQIIIDESGNPFNVKLNQNDREGEAISTFVQFSTIKEIPQKEKWRMSLSLFNLESDFFLADFIDDKTSVKERYIFFLYKYNRDGKNFVWYFIFKGKKNLFELF